MLGICDDILEVFPWPVMLPVRHHRPPPPAGGGPGSLTTTASGSRLIYMVTTLSMEASGQADLRVR